MPQLRALVPQRLLTFREAVRAALDAERTHRVAGRWTEGAFPHRAYRHDHAFYAKRASGTAATLASPAAVWRVVTAIGGDNRYYTMNFLWWLRELLDWLVGGPGFTHGRRDPVDLRVGDAIDYWTVLALEPERRLTLHFGMKAPGSGILEFELEPLAGRRHAPDRNGLLAPARRVGAALLVRDDSGAPVPVSTDDAGNGRARRTGRAPGLTASTADLSDLLEQALAAPFLRDKFLELRIERAAGRDHADWRCPCPRPAGDGSRSRASAAMATP